MKQRDRVVGVLVEIRVEDALVHEIRFLADIEQHPLEVVQLQRRQESSGAFGSVLRSSSAYARIAASRPGFTFAMIVNP